MIIGLPVWTAALDIANSSLAKKVPYSIAPPPEHMATDPISLVEQLKKISSISIDIDFDEYKIPIETEENKLAKYIMDNIT